MYSAPVADFAAAVTAILMIAFEMRNLKETNSQKEGIFHGTTEIAIRRRQCWQINDDRIYIGTAFLIRFQ